MSSYYKKVNGNLVQNAIARVEDINQIQANIAEGAEEYTKDMFGDCFILDDDEYSFQLTATTDYTDQVNTNYTNEHEWISFYDRYFRQILYTTKSSIKDITLHMKNNTNISTTIYAEIRELDFTLIQEASTILDPTLDDYAEITFNFNINHLPAGAYYLVLRPVDISATDLANSDSNIPNNLITPADFLVRYDISGEYHRNLTNESKIDSDSVLRGLEASYDGTNYLDAYLLEDQYLGAVDFNELDPLDPNYDLYFEEKYSSGNTYLIESADAVISGQKVHPYDTHVTINNASTAGDRTDLVILNIKGEYEVIEGNVYNGEKQYPVAANCLPIAYVTTFKDNAKLPVIEQDDESELLIRPRSLLERMRRVEKKTNYQMTNNSPSRIKYNCEVDPVMFNNGLTKDESDTEGSYALGVGVNSDGQSIVTNNNYISLIWSIIKNTHKYSYETIKTISGYCQVYNVDASTKKSTPKHCTEGLYIVYLSEHNLVSENDDRTITKPLKNENLTVCIKSGSTIKHTKTLITNSKGRATWNLTSLELKKGTYTVETIIPNNKEIKTKLVIHNKNYKATTGHKTAAIKVKDSIKSTLKEKLSLLGNNIITGDDAFSSDNGHIQVDTNKGVIQLAEVDTTKDKFISNTTLKPGVKPEFEKDEFPYETKEHKIYSDTKTLSHFPVMHFEFDRATYIKSIRPNISNFKNMKNFGIIFFKNDKVISMRDHKRKAIEKKFEKDVVYTDVYKSKPRSLAKAKTDKNGKQTLNDFVTFEVGKNIEPGTYTLVVYGELKKNKKEGIIYTREYKTLGNIKRYGISGTCVGSSKLSTFMINANNPNSWNVKITQRPKRYYETGTVISNPRTTTEDIQSCSISKNTDIPPNGGCSIELYVSNDGGSSWVDATRTNKVTFNSTNNIFRWKMVFHGGEYTPKLMYSEKKKYAIKFTLNTNTFYVPYEDFGRCYETPLFNANSITRTYVNNTNTTHTFSEWEWARIYMLDELGNSNIDICFSYSDSSLVGPQTLKSSWDSTIFFSQIFADLKLSDFSSTSIDYDNYTGNVEFDEHNYLFKIDSESLMHSSISLATPGNGNTASYSCGNIAGEDDKNNIDALFEQSDTSTEYQYYGNEDIEQNRHSGMHLKTGPYHQAVYKGTNLPANYNDNTDKNKFKYVINGVSFSNGVDIDENKSQLIIYLYPISATKTLFPANSFNINIALTLDGTLGDAITDSEGNTRYNYGIQYTIPHTLTCNEFNPVYIDISEEIEAFENNGLRSIGITVNEAAQLVLEEGIGIGLITAQSYSRRPYVPYTYSGNWDRFKWETCGKGGHIHNQCNISGYTFFYPSSFVDNNIENTGEIMVLKSDNTTISDLSSRYYSIKGTAIYAKNTITDRAVTKVNRNRNKITGYFKKTNENDVEVSSTSTGNSVVFDFPGQQTGNIFKIHTDLPFNIYDLIEVEYYVYHSVQDNKTNANDPAPYDNQVVRDDGVYVYDGYLYKGDIKIKFYTETDVTDTTVPVETFSLPSWGRVQQNADVEDKTVHAWFNKRSDANKIRTIVIERSNPTQAKNLPKLRLVLGNILLYNTKTMPSLGPQMQMRIYPDKELNDIQIRKTGCVYRL